MYISRDIKVINELPDPSLYDVDHLCAGFESHNSIIRGSSTHYHFPEHTAPLAVHCNFNGVGVYDESVSHYEVDDHSFLLINEGQRYSITIEAAKPVEAFYVFFRTGYAEEVHSALSKNTLSLLDDPTSECGETLRFVDMKYADDLYLKPSMLRLKSLFDMGSVIEEQLEEEFSLLMGSLLQSQCETFEQMQKLSAHRHSTRVELYKRLQRAREVMESSFCSELSLNMIASGACLSPHHFLRQFKALYGTTPHQYLIQKRLAKAKELLNDQNLSITEICHAVGFASLGSFSWMFRRHFGWSPEQLRKQTVK